MNGMESPAWVKYAGDLFFLALFLVFLFFFKPSAQSEDEWDDESADAPENSPNPLEKMLVSDDDIDEPVHDEQEAVITNPDELSQSDR